MAQMDAGCCYVLVKPGALEGDQRYGPALAPTRLGNTSEPNRLTLTKGREGNRRRSKRATTLFRQTMKTDRHVEEEDERNIDIPWLSRHAS